ncbi:type II toxin-antitoxin system ParD family antitoxin [Paraburkholderia sp. BR13444]|uniref:type II toxin-antitoxin system ParD family antitoxin n=1 Tax=Paraburkholderia sp. BR13444 TaxID=3236997 RepID=UPI0034CDD484
MLVTDRTTRRHLPTGRLTVIGYASFWDACHHQCHQSRNFSWRLVEEGSLEDKSSVQSMRRGKRCRVALKIADSEADAVRLDSALKVGEGSGSASRFDSQAFLRRMQATYPR